MTCDKLQFSSHSMFTTTQKNATVQYLAEIGIVPSHIDVEYIDPIDLLVRL